MRIQRIVGVALALIALAGGFFAAHQVPTKALEAARLEATQRAQSVTGDVLAALKALPSETLLETAKSGADVLRVKKLVSGEADRGTAEDFVREESGWAPIRNAGSSGVYVSNELYVSEGQQADLEATRELAVRAQSQGSAAAFLVAGQHVLLAAAAKTDSTANGQPASVSLTRPLTTDDLKPLATRFSVALSLAPKAGPALTAGDSALQALLTGTSPGVDRRPVTDELELAVATDVTPMLVKGEHIAGTQRTVAWAIAAVIAALGVLFAVWPRKPHEQQEALLQQTTAELARSREELNRLSKITSSLKLDADGAVVAKVTGGVLVPGADEGGGLDSTSRSPAPSRYQILGQLGEGGMARVYVAVSRGAEGFSRSFVIKRLRPELIGNTEAVNQFIDEGRLGASLVHSNIVPVLDFGRDADGYYLAQEYILGRNVDRLVETSVRELGQPLAPNVVLYLAQEALKALSYAHGKADDSGRPLGLVHRDVSPANLMVSERGEVKLLDFGIVKSEQRLTKTQTGMVKGNLFFMSPEQAKGLTVDPRSDLFSLSMVLLTALTGKTLYTGTTSYELLTRAGVGLTPEDLAAVRALPLGPLLERGLRLDPNERYPTADDFGAAVARFGSPATAAEVGALMRRLFGADFAKETENVRAARSGT